MRSFRWLVLALLVTGLLVGGNPAHPATVHATTAHIQPHADLAWRIQSTIGNSGNIYGSYFSDQQHGWAVGDNGGLYVTTDGGQTWSLKVTGTTNQLTAIFFADSTHGYAFGSNVLVRSTDGGATWQTLGGQLPFPMSDLSAPSATTLFASSTPGWGPDGVYKSTDGGQTWTNIFQLHGITDVSFDSPTDGWATGPYTTTGGEDSGGTLYHTVDGGQTWTTIWSDPNNTYRWVSFISPSVGYLNTGYGCPGTLLQTSDGGSTWATKSWPATDCPQEIELGNSGPTLGVAATDSDGYVGPGVYASTDGGISWAAQEVADPSYGVQSVNVGYRGTVPYVIANNNFYYYGYPLPTPTPTWTNTPQPTDTSPPTDTPIPTDTPFPTNTPIPTRTSVSNNNATNTPTTPSNGTAPTRTSTPRGGTGHATATPTPTKTTDTSDTSGGKDIGSMPTDTPVPLSGTSTQSEGHTVRCHASTLQQVVACAEPSVLRIVAHLSDGDAQGTGFVVRSDSDGVYVLTNRHVVEGATTSGVRVISPNGHTTYTVRRIILNNAADGSAGDLAIIRLAPAHLNALSFGGNVSPGETVASIGYGLAFELAGPPSVTEGIISAVGRDLGDGFGPRWIQHQSTLNHGNSGGPLLDLHGNVVGVNTLSIDQIAGSNGNSESVQGIFFAIPAALAQSIAHRLIAEQGSASTQLAAVRKRPQHLTLSTVSLTVPHEWLVNHLSRTTPAASTRDQLAQVRLSLVTLHRGQTLNAVLRHLIHLPRGARIKIVHLAGRTGRQIALTPHKKGATALWLTVIPDSVHGRVVVVQVSERAGTTTVDRRQVSSVLASIHIARPKRARHHH